MIMEYVPFGDLKHYLQELRKQVILSEHIIAVIYIYERFVFVTFRFQNDLFARFQNWRKKV